MRTLLVLCAGSRKVNHLPVFLNRHPDGKLLAEKAIEGIFSETYQKIVYVITMSIDQEYDARKKLLSGIDRDIEVICLLKETNGPADTVFQAIKQAGISGEFAVRDCLNSIEIEKNVYGNFISGLDLTTYNQDVYKVRTKSFIVVNEQNQILDIIEKRFRSDVISVGLYGFKNTDDFLMAYEKLSDPSYPIKKLYISNIISFLIGYSQRIFHCVPVNKHEDWGSLETWNLLQREYAACIVDADSVVGEVLSDSSVEILADCILKAGKRHIQFIIITVGDICSETVINSLQNHGINCIGVIPRISQSNKRTIVTSKDELRLATMEI